VFTVFLEELTPCIKG